MKQIVSIIILSMLGFTLQAQNKLSLSLKEALNLALGNNIQLKTQELEIKQSENNLNKAKAPLMPQIKGSLDVRYNTQLQYSIFPQPFIDVFHFNKIRFGTTNFTAATFEFSQNILSMEKFSDIKIAKQELAKSSEHLNSEMIDVKLNITLAYYQAMLNREELRIADEDEQRNKELYDISSLKYDEGTILENDMLRAKLNWHNAKIEKQKKLQSYILSLKNINKLLSIEQNTDIILTDSLFTDISEVDAFEFVNPVNTVNKRSEIKEQILQSEIYSLNRKKANMGYVPTLSLYANFTYLYQGDNFMYNGKFWDPYSYIGIKLELPIFNGLQQRNNFIENKIKQEESDLKIQDMTNNFLYELTDSWQSYTDAIDNLSYLKDNYRLAQDIFNSDLEKYKEGIILYSDLTETKRSMSDAEKIYCLEYTIIYQQK